MLADYDARRPNEIFAERDTNWLTLEDAYTVLRVVAELRRARGERCLGFKIGCVSPAIQTQLGLHQPVHGYLWDTEAHLSGSRLAAARFARLAVEGEIALRLRRDFPTGPRTSLDEISDYIEGWFPVIELHNHVFRGAKLTSQELVAGNAMHAGFVAPSDQKHRDLTAMDRAEIRVEIDGIEVENKNVAVLPDGPLGSLRWLASALALAGQTLKAGTTVLTGSPGRLIPIQAGCSVVVSCEGQRVEFTCTEGPA